MAAISSAPGAPHAKLLSVGAYRPERVVGNDEICEQIDSSDQWIRERTGIITRRRAAPDESVVDMAEQASRVAIERAGLRPADIDAVLVATVTYPWQLPSAAAKLTHQLGSTPAAAVDVSAACAGFCYALAMAADMVRGGSAGTVLVVGSEKLSDFTDPTDRGSAFIFGDGAGAVVVGGSQTPGIGPAVWGSDGSQWDLISARNSWLETRDAGSWPWLTMAGPSVFRWAVWQMSPVAQKALDAAGVRVSDLAAFIPHQANLRIVEAMSNQLRLPEHVALSRDIVHTGNTSSASVPLAMDALLASGDARAGDLALLIGFGGGLAYAAQVVELP